ncbi:isovaleryl-CoA dehydrogenase [Candidatus Berkiella aquae]|uniref:Isovaleryl-CoA dehydrogenase, mitochondrial n=2 Tax=Candidatus Berkiella aquae TaxID=295108 RepID=A0A0Q9YNM4_9GAMM
MMPMISGLSETASLIRDTVYEFAQREIAPLAQQIDETNTFPAALWQKMGALGLLGITVKEEFGGSQLGYLAHVIAMEEISRASASIGLSYGAHSNLCVNQIHRNGTPEQKLKYLPKLLSGEHVGALAMSESGSGSDVMSLSLNATRHGDFYRLNGSKMWITNGPDANILIVYARTDKDKGPKGITAFIIEKDFPGYKTAQKLDKLGMRGSNTCELVFEDCDVPAENILGTLNDGASVLMSGLNYERLILAAGPVGIMQACLDVVVPYVHERKQFGKAIGQYQFIQGKVADMYTALSASRAFLYQLAQHVDNSQILDNKDAAAVILFTSEHATQIALEAIQCLGGNGYVNEYPTGRLLRDAKLYEIGAGTSEIRRIIIGREIFNEGN